jgi:hypothetical protein
MKRQSINDPKLSEGARRTLLYALEKFAKHHGADHAAVIELYENGFITIESDGSGLAVRLT